MNQSYNIELNHLPSRIDKLASKITTISRSRIQKLIKNRQIKIDNKIIDDPSFIVNLAEILEINQEDIKEYEESHNIIPKKIDFEILFEDEYLAVINKPAGLTVHSGAGNYQDTLVNGLVYHFKNSLSDIGDSIRPGIIHRLDKDTSGLMIIAKNNFAHEILAKQIENRSAKRVYLAVIWGFLKETEGKISKNIARSNSDRKKMTIVQTGGKSATTYYKTMEVFKRGLCSLVECTLETGRTHQIRVHMSKSGHSIIGDNVYGNNTRKVNSVLDSSLQEQLKRMNRQALHAYKISFSHPLNGELMSFSVEPPNDMNNLIEKLREFS